MAEPTHYEVLDVPRGAPADVIETAYRAGRALYDEEAVATYSLLDSRGAPLIRARLDEAYRVLGNPVLRAAYDRELGLPPPPAGPPTTVHDPDARRA